MNIFGLEIKKIEKKDMPRVAKDESFSLKTEFTKKGEEYLFGLKGGPFSSKRNQGYLHYDGLRMVNGRVYFMWKGSAIVSIGTLGGNNGNTMEIGGLIGKQKVNFS